MGWGWLWRAKITFNLFYWHWVWDGFWDAWWSIYHTSGRSRPSLMSQMDRAWAEANPDYRGELTCKCFFKDVLEASFVRTRQGRRGICRRYLQVVLWNTLKALQGSSKLFTFGYLSKINFLAMETNPLSFLIGTLTIQSMTFLSSSCAPLILKCYLLTPVFIIISGAVFMDFVLLFFCSPPGAGTPQWERVAPPLRAVRRLVCVNVEYQDRQPTSPVQLRKAQL